MWPANIISNETYTVDVDTREPVSIENLFYAAVYVILACLYLDTNILISCATLGILITMRFNC